jgi:hypothetical protein
VHNPATGEAEVSGEPDYHGDPVRPHQGSLVYRIPAWDVLEQLMPRDPRVACAIKGAYPLP